MTDLAQAKALIIYGLRSQPPLSDAQPLADQFESGALRVVSSEVMDALEAVAKAAEDLKVSASALFHGTSQEVLGRGGQFEQARDRLYSTLTRLDAARRKEGA